MPSLCIFLSSLCTSLRPEAELVSREATWEATLALIRMSISMAKKMFKIKMSVMRISLIIMSLITMSLMTTTASTTTLMTTT